MKKKPKFTTQIKGIDWSFYVQSQSAFNRSNGSHAKDAEAITYPHDREVYFNSAYLSPYTVKHEIMHVFVASSSVSSSSLDSDQREELCAELYGEHGSDMDALAEKILNYFLR